MTDNKDSLRNINQFDVFKKSLEGKTKDSLKTDLWESYRKNLDDNLKYHDRLLELQEQLSKVQQYAIISCILLLATITFYTITG